MATTPKCPYVFSSRSDAMKSFPDETITSSHMLDPYYFACLVPSEKPITKLLMSFFNSIYFPDAGEKDFKIRRIEPFKLQAASDIAYRCFCNASETLSSDSTTTETSRELVILMHRTWTHSWLMKLLDDCDGFGDKNVKMLGLLDSEPPIDQSIVDESAWYTWCKPFQDNNPDCRGKKFDMNEIDLRAILEKEHVFVDGKELGSLGITWLKLLGVRYWCRQVERKKPIYEIFYPEDKIDENIKYAIEKLSNVSYACLRRVVETYQDEEYTRVTEQAKGEARGYVRGRAEGIAEGMAEGLAKGRAKGIAKGRAEGLALGYTEGLDEGYQRVIRFLEGIMTKEKLEEFKKAVEVPLKKARMQGYTEVDHL